MAKELDAQMTVAVVMASDWCYYEQTKSIYDKFTPIDGYIVGFILEEDEEKIVLAHQVFKDNESVRHVTVITKTSIIERFDMKIDDECDEEVEEDLEIEE